MLNGFIQSLVGLYDYAGLANSDDGRALFAAGRPRRGVEVPHYDTGAWSLYDQSTESDLSYHTLLRDFLSHLCDRLRATAAAPGPPARRRGAAGSGAERAAGGAPAAGARAAAPPSGWRARPDVYCTTAAHFTAYMHQPPVIAVAAVGRGAGRVDGAPAPDALEDLGVTLTAQPGGRTVYRHADARPRDADAALDAAPAPGRYQLRVGGDRPGREPAGAGAVTVVSVDARRVRHRLSPGH